MVDIHFVGTAYRKKIILRYYTSGWWRAMLPLAFRDIGWEFIVEKYEYSHKYLLVKNSRDDIQACQNLPAKFDHASFLWSHWT